MSTLRKFYEVAARGPQSEIKLNEAVPDVPITKLLRSVFGADRRFPFGVVHSVTNDSITFRENLDLHLLEGHLYTEFDINSVNETINFSAVLSMWLEVDGKQQGQKFDEDFTMPHPFNSTFEREFRSFLVKNYNEIAIELIGRYGEDLRAKMLELNHGVFK